MVYEMLGIMLLTSVLTKEDPSMKMQRQKQR